MIGVRHQARMEQGEKIMNRNRGRPVFRKSNRGATLVETAISLFAFLLLILGMLDFGVCVLHYNSLSSAVRIGGRKAIVHGSFAPPEFEAWDSASMAEGVKAAISPILNSQGIKDDEITVTVTLTDGPDVGVTSNDPGDFAQIEVQVPYRLVCGKLLGYSQITLTGKTTMVIAH